MAKTVIALVNRKGGTGKTTSAVYMAAALHAQGRGVLGIDADPDASWLKMGNAGILPYPVVAGDRERMADQIEAAEEDVLVIDTPPNRSEEHTSELQSRGHLVCRLLLEK